VTAGASLLEIDRLVHDYRLPRTGLLTPAPRRRALDGVTLRLARGECLGLVGESGSGKSTLARAAMGIQHPTAGSVRLMGQDLYAARPAELRRLRRHFQMVFQDPYGSLDPRHKVGRIVTEPLHALAIGGAEARSRTAKALAAVGLEAAMAERYPHELSGGQRQRVAIARALVTEPALVVADEPVSALDMSVQTQVVELMLGLKRRLGLAFLLISHDLAVVAHMAERVAVLESGRIVEEGPTDRVLTSPAHPYTRRLLAATLPADPVRARAALLQAWA
jgi:peptide/nickel transport system ATP-binding protein